MLIDSWTLETNQNSSAHWQGHDHRGLKACLGGCRKYKRTSTEMGTAAIHTKEAVNYYEERLIL